MSGSKLVMMAFSLAAVNSASGQVSYTTIATSGTPIGDGIISISSVYKHTRAPLTPDGRAGFVANISGPGIQEGTQALLFGNKSGLQLVTTANNINEFAMADAGNFAVEVNRQILVGKPGAMQSVLNIDSLAGTAPAGTTLEPYVTNLQVNGQDQFAFLAYYRLNFDPPARARTAAFFGSPAGTSMVAGADMPAPGSNGRTFVDVVTPVLNEAGEVSFAGFMTRDDPASNSGAWVWHNGTIRPVAVVGQAAPGTGANYDNIDWVSIDDAGRVGFRAWVDACCGGGRIFVNEGGTTRLIGNAQQPAPGTSTVFDHFNGPHLSQSGKLVFSAHLSASGSDDWGIWAGDADNYKLIARSGQPAPGTNTSFRELYWSSFSNNAGQVVFSATLFDGEKYFSGAWATDVEGNLLPVVLMGHPLTIDGVTRTVEDFNFGIGPLNDAGQVAFRVTFTDGTTSLMMATVPEPGVPALALVVSLFLLHRRRSRSVTSPHLPDENAAREPRRSRIFRN